MTFFILILVLWLVSLTLHEYAHARVAFAGGDTSVEEKGYLSMNPLLYMDVKMSIIFPLIILAVGGVPLPGGAVWINHSLLRSRHWEAAVAAAGPAANLLLLILCGLAFKLGLVPSEAAGEATLVPLLLGFFAYLMAFASFINLLPVPGLDGFGIIEPYLPRNIQEAAREFGGIAIMLLLVALIVPDSPLGKYLSLAAVEATLFVGVPWEAIIEGFNEFKRFKLL